MEIKDKIALLPHQPGVYRYLDSEGNVIYVGKAKDLFKRVSQYFVDPQRLNTKTRVLVSKIADLQHTVVSSESDALLLENNLIKQYQPRYNILLKDSKTYPWLCVKNEAFPRVFLTRHFIKDGSKYFGPYSSVSYAKHLVDLIYSLYPLRTCSMKLSGPDIEKGKYKVCLKYHIGKCKAPCTGGVSKEEYDGWINNIMSVLKGDSSALEKDYREKMMEAAGRMEFELAQSYKEKLQLLGTHCNRSIIVHPSISNVDVFSIAIQDFKAFGNYFRVSNGCIIQALNLEMKLNIEEEKEEVLARFISGIYNILLESSPQEDPSESATDFRRIAAQEILVPFPPAMVLEGSQIHVPVKGDKLALLELCTKNANAFRFVRLKQETEVIEEKVRSISPAVEKLQADLGMNQLPMHIECFDNSNIQGTNPVAACVVFRNGVPSKKDYRHFLIKTVTGANDFASMYEVVTRRYRRLLDEDQPLPQLIVIDGGKGQVHFAMNALNDLGLAGRIKLIGIAERLEELIIPGESNSLIMSKNSLSLKLIMQLRDEAHRFGITHHRNRRSKSQTSTALDSIKGIGPASQQKLLKAFGSFKRIMEASPESLASAVGSRLAGIIENFRKENSAIPHNTPSEEQDNVQ